MRAWKKINKTGCNFIWIYGLIYVSLYGKAEIVNDPEENAKRWKEEWIAFYPDREESYILIKFTPNRLELISESRNLVGDAVTWTPEIYYFSEK